MLTIAGGILLGVLVLIGIYAAIMIAAVAFAKVFGGVGDYLRLAEFHRWMRRNYPKL